MVAAPPGFEDAASGCLEGLPLACTVVTGGASRQASVHAALAALADDVDVVTLLLNGASSAVLYKTGDPRGGGGAIPEPATWAMMIMGFGVAGVLGAKFAAPDRPCVSVCGDGAFFMHANVLGTAGEYDLPCVWVVWNNYAYASIRGLQRGYLGGRELATDFHDPKTGERYNPDFAAMARSAVSERSILLPTTICGRLASSSE